MGVSQSDWNGLPELNGLRIASAPHMEVAGCSWMALAGSANILTVNGVY
jgi:hypothetical protein